MTYPIDDPRITAYVLGELHEPELSAFELVLARSPELQSAVEQTRETISLLDNVFESEPAWQLDASRREQITQAAAPGYTATVSRRDDPPTRRGAAPVLAVVTLVLLAGFAVLLNSHGSPSRTETLAKLDQVETLTELDRDFDSSGDNLVEELALAENTLDSLSVMADLTQHEAKPRELLERGVTVLSTVPAQKPQGVTSFSIQDAESKNGLTNHRFYRNADKYGYQVAGQSSAATVPTQPYYAIPPGANVVRGWAKQKLQWDDGYWGVTNPQARSGRVVTRFDQSQPGLGAKEQQSGQSWNFKQPALKGPETVNDFVVELSDESRLFGEAVRQQNEGFKQGLPQLAEQLVGLEKAVAGKGIELQRQQLQRQQLQEERLKRIAGFEQPAAEQYEPIVENPFIEPVGQSALSTFSIDVDTASYANVRRFLNNGQLPPPNAVRIEELVNYFRYDYPQPADGQPFSVNTEVAACPWQPRHRLVRFGLKGREILKEQRPATNLVFLIDTSGSMSSGNKLPLVKTGLEMVVKQLGEGDRIAIVTYAGNAGLALPSTPAVQQGDILEIIRNLESGGSTNGAAGITLAYQQAVQNFVKDGANRVILCTDGDFNVGVSSDNELVDMIEKKRNSGVFLSVLGFGMGNLKDAKLEKLADKGNGFYGYIDSEREAKRVFERELAGTLYTIAKDVKIQVEFNPAKVGAYRLVGYENRMLAARDFHDDRKDAGEIGAGHSVTALYEIIPFNALPAVAAKVDDLKYQRTDRLPGENSTELCTLKLRYKAPDADKSDLDKFAVEDLGTEAVEPSPDFEWQASVAAFGMLLRNSEHKGQASWPLVSELCAGAVGDDPHGQREEFQKLVKTAATLAQ